VAGAGSPHTAQPIAIATLRSPRIVTVQVLLVAESHPLVRKIGWSPGSLSPGVRTA